MGLTAATVLSPQDTDLVPSDIAAGFTLLHQQQDNISHSREPQEVVTHTPGQPQVMTNPPLTSMPPCGSSEAYSQSWAGSTQEEEAGGV